MHKKCLREPTRSKSVGIQKSTAPVQTNLPNESANVKSQKCVGVDSMCMSMYYTYIYIYVVIWYPFGRCVLQANVEQKYVQREVPFRVITNTLQFKAKHNQK